jgi:hypothetical protein
MARGCWNALAPSEQGRVVVGAAVDVVRSRRDLVLENAMLRQQIVILQRRAPHPKLTSLDRWRLVVAARLVLGWRSALAIVQPKTLLRWHREGFRRMWRRRSRALAQPRLSTETIDLIRQMAIRNRLWGAERIRGELLSAPAQTGAV